MPSHFVKVDLIHGAPVQARLGFGQGAKYGERSSGHAVGQGRRFNQSDNVGVRPDHDVVRDRHHGPGGGDAPTQDRLGAERPAGKGQALQHGLDFVDIGAGVEQAAQGHVAGNAGKAME